MSVNTFNDRTTDPDAPDTGKVKFYMKDKTPHWRDDEGNVHTLEGNIFGQNIDLSVYESYTMTTSGQTWDTYCGLQMPQGSDGTYLVFGFFHLRMNSTGYDSWARLAKNGTEIEQPMKEELKDSSSNESMPRMLLKKVDLVAGDYLDLDFATESTNATLTIREGIIVLWRIA